MLFAKYANKEAIKTSTSILCGDIPKTEFASEWRQADFKYEYDSKIFPEIGEDLSFLFNSHGYRCPEFNSPRGDINVVSLGCSEAAGLGVSTQHRFSAVFCELLTKSTGRTVVDWNLGISGTSNDFLGRLLPTAISQLKPEIVLVCFTYYARREHIHKSGKVFDFLATKSIKYVPYDYLEEWNSLLNLNNHYSNLMNLSKNMAIIELAASLANVPWLYAFLADENSHAVKRHNFVGYFDHLDYATDKLHAGKRAHRYLGEKFFEKYNESGDGSPTK